MRSTSGLARWSALVTEGLWRGRWLYAGVLLASLPFPLILGIANASYLAIVIMTVGVGVGLVYLEEPSFRRVMIGLLGIGLSLRFVTLIVIHAVARAAGGPFLGPDSTTYLARSIDLAARGFQIPQHPALYLGSFDSAHYYLFASMIYAFDADLFALQLLNSGLIVLVGLLTFAWTRRVAPGAALWIGLGATLYPNLVVLSVLDLLKDPSVLFALTCTIWAFVHLVSPSSIRRTAVFITIGMLGLAYLRMDRFYMGILLEVAVAAAVITYIRQRHWAILGRVLVIWTLMFAATELGTARLGWPTSSLMLSLQFSQSRRPGGLLSSQPAPPAEGETPPPSPAIEQPAENAQTMLESRRDQAGFARRVAWFGADAFRKLYGPFVWIMPERFEAREILTNDYLLYPGMLVLYGIFPFVSFGFARTGLGLVRGPGGHIMIAVLWFFTLASLALYLAIDLSYRQREVLAPLFFFFAAFGWPLVKSRAGRVIYALYWLGIAGVAAAHLVARSVIFG